MPIYPGLVQGHLLCAGQEFPLTGSANVLMIQSTQDQDQLKNRDLLCDYDLFGSEDIYLEALETLQVNGAVQKETIAVRTEEGKAIIFKTHPSIKNPWTKVSIRSMESVNYDIVDISHPMQGMWKLQLLEFLKADSHAQFQCSNYSHGCQEVEWIKFVARLL